MSAFWIFVGKYWLTFVFGGIAAAMTAIATRNYKLYIRGKKAVQEEKNQQLLEKAETMMDQKHELMYQECADKHTCLVEQDKEIVNRLNKVEGELTILKKGILSIQGRQFKEECRLLIQSEEPITLEQFTRLQEEHDTYNSLGGNHEGDMLFGLVEQKYLTQIS